jgi:ubiquinone biosynthesis protein COQ9
MKHSRNAASRHAERQQHVIAEALKLATFEGWSEATLAKAAVAAGLPAIEARRLFAGGVAEALTWYDAHLNMQLHSMAASSSLTTMRVHERVHFLVKARLDAMTPHKEAIRRALAWQAVPWHGVLWQKGGNVFARGWHIADTIWHLAGDTSTDFNYYTKRSLLLQVYASTLLFWLNDDSPEHAESWAFLTRRIDDVLRVGKSIGKTRASVMHTVENAADMLLNRRRYRTKR